MSFCWHNRGGNHELDAVELVHFRGTRIEINGHNVGLWDSGSVAP